ncbi:MAG: hypothetical protein RL653_1621 [Pseudomonadota bacterium]|jgi:hypothetical protein
MARPTIHRGAVLLALLAGVGAWAEEVPAGTYLSGLGSLLLERVGSDKPFIAGRLQLPVDGCGLETGRVVADLQQQGSAVVGTVLLCQKGQGCDTRPVEFLGFWLPAHQSIVGTVALAPGCSSPALAAGNQLVLVSQPGVPRMPVRPAAQADVRGQQELGRAERLEAMGQLKESVSAWRQSLTWMLTPAAYAGLARTLLAVDAKDAARLATERAMELDGVTSEAWSLRARTWDPTLEAARVQEDVEEAKLRRSREEAGRPRPEATRAPAGGATAAGATAAAAPGKAPVRPRELPLEDTVVVEFIIKPASRVVVDGVNHGDSSTMEPLRLRPGKHKLQLTNMRLNKQLNLEFDAKLGANNIVKYDLEKD